MTASTQPRKLSTAKAGIEYVRMGWALCEYATGTKGPTAIGWNLRENAITTVEQAARVTMNIGILAGYSGLAVVDVDALDKARDQLGGFGLDLDEWIHADGAVLITRGHPNKVKLLFKLPEGLTLPTKMFSKHGYELRCMSSRGTSMQDVAPPSLHPSGVRYEWIGDWRHVPPMPPELLEHWQSLAVIPDRGEAKPLGAGRADLEQLLDKIDPTELHYDEWLNVGMALHHETGGGPDGFALWDQWSSRSPKYQPDYQEGKYSSFRKDTPHPITLRSLMHMAGQGLEPPFEDLTAAAAALDDAEELPPTAERALLGPARSILTHWEIEGAPPDPAIVTDGHMLEDAGGLVAPGGTGKTTLAIWESVHIILGRELWGRRVVKPGAVLFVSAEDSKRQIAANLNRICREMELNDAEREKVRQQFFLEDLSDITARLLADDGGVLRRTKLPGAIADAYRGCSISYVHLDPVSLIGPGEASGNDGMAELMRTARWLSRELKAAVRLTHHVSQAVARGGIQDQYAGRGGTAFADNARFIHQLISIKNREYVFEETKYQLPASITDDDLQRGRVLAMLVHKISYQENAGRPIFILRRGFHFEHIEAQRPMPNVPSIQVEQNIARICEFLADQLAMGVKNSANDLENCASRLDMKRAAIRDALKEGVQRKLIIEQKLPATEVKGRRTHHLMPALDTSIEGLPT